MQVFTTQLKEALGVKRLIVINYRLNECIPYIHIYLSISIHNYMTIYAVIGKYSMNVSLAFFGVLRQPLQRFFHLLPLHSKQICSA